MGTSDLDWSALDLSKNPVPGEKSAIDRLASQFSANGDRCYDVSHSITSACGKAPDFKGDSAKQLQQSLSQVAQFAGRLSDVCEDIEQALRSWGSAVDTSQQTAYKDCQRAMDLRDSIAQNQKKLDQAKQTLKTNSDNLKKVRQTNGDSMSRETNRLLGVINSTTESITHYQGLVTGDKAEIKRLKGEVSWVREQYKNAAKQTTHDLDECVDKATAKAMQLDILNHAFTVGGNLSGVFEALSGIALLMTADPALIEGLKLAGLIGDGLSGNWLGPIVEGLIEVGNLVAPAIKTSGRFAQVATMVAGTATTAIAVNAFGCIVGGIADSFDTYYSRKEAYGEQAATQDAIAHGLIAASSAAEGAVAGAIIGSIAPGPGTIVGAGIGLVVGLLGAAVPNALYDDSVNRGDGDDLRGHLEDNL
ncbi:hypothetical protein [Bifidobacterium sp. ESL0819]|uniref:hypothetical protein n=1 Tax=Bifidobacterium sp. ESL0819 TaxID=3448589 RepID=UPI00404302D9